MAIILSWPQCVKRWHSAHKSNTEFDGMLPKGPYPPCLRMANRALLAGYPELLMMWHTWVLEHLQAQWWPSLGPVYGTDTWRFNKTTWSRVLWNIFHDGCSLNIIMIIIIIIIIKRYNNILQCYQWCQSWHDDHSLFIIIWYFFLNRSWCSNRSGSKNELINNFIGCPALTLMDVLWCGSLASPQVFGIWNFLFVTHGLNFNPTVS